MENGYENSSVFIHFELCLSESLFIDRLVRSFNCAIYRITNRKIKPASL